MASWVMLWKFAAASFFNYACSSTGMSLNEKRTPAFAGVPVRIKRFLLLADTATQRKQTTQQTHSAHSQRGRFGNNLGDGDISIVHRYPSTIAI